MASENELKKIIKESNIVNEYNKIIPSHKPITEEDILGNLDWTKSDLKEQLIQYIKDKKEMLGINKKATTMEPFDYDKRQVSEPYFEKSNEGDFKIGDNFGKFRDIYRDTIRDVICRDCGYSSQYYSLDLGKFGIFEFLSKEHRDFIYKSIMETVKNEDKNLLKEVQG